MKLNVRLGVYALLVVASGVFIFASTEGLETKIKRTPTFTIPTQMDFSGENAPLHISDVRERLDREMVINMNLHSTTTLILKRANRTFPIIEPILKKYGVPDDFKYLAVIESGLVNVVSPAGAKGVWQFMPETAKEKGMEVNDIVDERYHLEKSTEAACKYLLEAKSKFGNWTLAAAAYNGGVAGVTRQMNLQQESNYYDLLLTEETSRYVFRILALKEIMRNPVKYGFEIATDQLYYPIETKKIDIDSSITDLASFAKNQGINYKILKIHNPWLRDRKLENKTKKKYIIEIPKEGY
jgi:membrane-bound lytic murein transglycosylase D